MKQTLTSLFFLFVLSSSFAQDQLAIGQWQAHLPYTRFTQATQNDEFLFFSTSLALLVIDKEENTSRLVSKIDGLSETGVRVMKANQETGLLVVTYDNAVFDLITPDRIIGFSEISRDGNFNDRSINDLTFEDQFIYFATGFGLVKFDVEREEFVYTVSTGMPVSDVAIFDGHIYIATEDGIFFIENSESSNPQAFGDWQLIGAAQNFPPNYFNEFLEAKDDYLYMDIDDTFVRFDGSVMETISPAVDTLVTHFLTAENQKIVMGFRGVCDPNCKGQINTWDPSTETLLELSNACIDRPTFAIEDENGNIWTADLFEDVRISDDQGGSCQQIDFNSPFSEFIFEIAVIDGSVHVASGGLKVNGSNQFRDHGVFVRDAENDWSTFNGRYFPSLKEDGFAAQNDFVRIVGHPSNDKVYYGTYYGGLVVLDTGSFTVYNDTNSTLQGATGDERRERVAGLAFDAQENLWMTNNSAPRAISVFSNEEEWTSFDVPATNLAELAIDRIGYKWAAINGTGQGLLVFDDNGTIDDPSDDRSRIITTNNSNLPDNQVLCVETDLQGDVWVGTMDGVVVFECGSSALDASCIGNKRIVEENDIDDESENLLKGEVVNTIGIDGANRKWFGTSSGVFVQDENGTGNIAFFNEENSPLLDDNVIDIAFDQETGDVFIGTEKGLSQIRTDAVAGGPVHNANIYAYPNPVRPDYDGPIAIKGLANNANVKITDISGTLIFETTALGGQAIWDGRDYNGRKASTGVYLVFSTADNIVNPDAATTKILFIK